jgi:hypothetical protein
MCEYFSMSEKRFEAGEDGDEQELINAEFESMVSGLNLDQSTPHTYLDDLDAIERAEHDAIYNIPRSKKGLHRSVSDILRAISNWWRRDKDQYGDGAQV